MSVYEKTSGKGHSMCSTGIVGMTSKNEIKVKFVFDLRWFVVRNMEDWGKSYKKWSLEEALLLDLYSINKRGHEKHSNREIRVCDARI